MAYLPAPARVIASVLLLWSSASLWLNAAPTAVDDVYSTTEDTPLVVSPGGVPIVEATFDTYDVAFSGHWSVLTTMENATGLNRTYPVDGAGLDWKSVG